MRRNAYFSERRKKAFNAVGFELLQGLPVNYTESAGGKNKREPLIGNGWCVPVIEHIFSFLKKDLLHDSNT